MSPPMLSICVPSRNRQDYFQDTIRFLVDNPRADVEFVFADNSDDPQVMNDFMAGVDDPRVIYLPAETRVLSMQENWARTLAATSGDWVSVIGDDDLIDPDLVDALKIAVALKPGLEAFGWSNLKYSWIQAGDTPRNVKVPLSATFHDMPPALIQRRAFHWDDAGATITSGFSVYHAALSRVLLNRMTLRFGSVLGHPVVDYDTALKAAAIGRSFVYCQRPFSIFGACPESNSAALYNIRRLAEMNAVFFAETGRTTDKDPWMADFPFPSTLGLPAAVAQVQQWLAHEHGVPMMAGWEANFARACARNCGFFGDREEFDIAVGEYEKAFSRWKGGAHRAHFQPTFVPAMKGAIYTGPMDGHLYVSDQIGGATSPSSFYRAVNALLPRPHELAPELRTASTDSTVIARLDAKRA